MNNKIPESRTKAGFKKLLRFATIAICLILLYLITFGGQYSIKNYFRSRHEHERAMLRNQAQVEENNKLAEENYRILTDTEKQTELSNELGYKAKGEQIIKRTE